MYYIKRRDEGMHPEWGGDPVYWLELDQHGTCLRCLAEYPNGMVLSYDTSHPHDVYGDVPVMVMTPDEAPWWQEFFIDQATFEARWQGHHPLNRTLSPHQREPRTVSHLPSSTDRPAPLIALLGHGFDHHPYWGPIADTIMFELLRGDIPLAFCGVAEARQQVVATKRDWIQQRTFTYPHWSVTPATLHDDLAAFLAATNPACLLLHGSLADIDQWWQACYAVGWEKPLFAYLDLLENPHDPVLREIIQSPMQVLTTTNYAASILSQRGATQGTVVPYGVDHSLFRRMTVLDRRWPATQASPTWVIGVLGDTTERFDYRPVLVAVAAVRQRGVTDMGVVIPQALLSPQSHHWQLLSDILSQFDLETAVIFSPDLDPQPDQRPLIEAINHCHVVLYPAVVGGGDPAVMQVQACGIPLGIPDDPALRECAGAGAFIIPLPTDEQRVSDASHMLADILVQMKTDRVFRHQRVNTAREHSKQYTWETLRTTIRNLVQDETRIT